MSDQARSVSYLKVCLLPLGGFLAAILILEVALRLFGPSWIAYRVREIESRGSSLSVGSDALWPIDRRNGKVAGFIPGARFAASHPEYSHPVQIDEWGGRATLKSDSARDEKRVPFLGDSMSFGVGVRDSETYLSLLGREVNVRLLNLGVPGSSLPNQLDAIERKHRELGSPPLYLFVFFPNDISEIAWQHGLILNKEGRSGWYGSGGRGNSPWAIRWERELSWLNLHLACHPLFGRLYSVQFLKSQLLMVYNLFYQTRKIDRRMDPSLLVMTQDSHFADEAGECLGKEVERLVRLSRRLRFAPFFILIPDRYQVYPELLRMRAAYYHLNLREIDVELPQRMIKEKLREHGIPFLDLLECLRTQGKDLYYRQDFHLTPAGHRAVKECLSPHLKRIVASYFPEGSGALRR
ncbi:MAG: SGNH/GDSL hydrolase family protein [Candidatus Omnitrophica bacterium]|nr:SGNH/GDSL hydrolase family protein [Candidatus Omnitrophota bacterium]